MPLLRKILKSSDREQRRPCGAAFSIGSLPSPVNSSGAALPRLRGLRRQVLPRASWRLSLLALCPCPHAEARRCCRLHEPLQADRPASSSIPAPVLTAPSCHCRRTARPAVACSVVEADADRRDADHCGELKLSCADSEPRYSCAAAGRSRIRSGCVHLWPRKIGYLIPKGQPKVFGARFVAAAALATAALVAHDDVGDTGADMGAIDGGSAFEEDLDAIDDADWDLFEVPYVAGPKDSLSRSTLRVGH